MQQYSREKGELYYSLRAMHAIIAGQYATIIIYDIIVRKCGVLKDWLRRFESASRTTPVCSA